MGRKYFLLLLREIGMSDVIYSCNIKSERVGVVQMRSSSKRPSFLKYKTVYMTYNEACQEKLHLNDEGVAMLSHVVL